MNKFIIENITAFEKKKPKVGYWVFDDECKEHGHCPRCGYGSIDLVNGEPHNYCSNCGAKLIIEPQTERREHNG